nr:isoform 6 of ccr4-not transcription complex subunit 4 [Quercus suber]
MQALHALLHSPSVIVTEDEEGGEEGGGDDGCLDDWEAVADALVAENINLCSESSPEREFVAELVSSREANDGVGLGGGDLKLDRPKMQSLPNPTRHYGEGVGGVTWGCNKVVSMPTSCSICYEDLDFTNSSFLPCLCRFRLCLFCHKRIFEEDGSCPGCKKPYEANTKAETSVHGGLLFPLSPSLSRG